MKYEWDEREQPETFTSYNTGDNSIIEWQKKFIEQLKRENIELTRQNAELYREINALKAELTEAINDGLNR
jgi:predicted RNase H-like nuclease (RuvC/YqgF family)